MIPVQPKATRQPDTASHITRSLEQDIDAWEGEGGAVPAPPGFHVVPMSRAANPDASRPPHPGAREGRTGSRGTVITIGRRKAESSIARQTETTS